jgi:DNA-binding NarL/FixJ family response regulator
MTGVQLAEKLRAAFPEMAILIASGPHRGPVGADAEALGISVFVNKPLPLGPLRQAVLRLARSSAGQPHRAAAAHRRLAERRPRRHKALRCATCSAGSRAARAPWVPPASQVCWPAA